MDVKIVVDVDDTICTNIRRLPYSMCEPVPEVIDTINHLHDDLGFTIVLYTARGMVSCNGDIERIIAKNKDVLIEWLKKHHVSYDELVFGKPIADVYVDDKALNVSEFKKETFYQLKKGGSGRNIYRLGNIVKKDIGDGVESFKDWIEDNGGICKFPRVISYLYGTVTMEYVEGTNLCDSFTRADFYKLLSTVERFAERKKGEFDISEQIAVLEKNKSADEEFNEIIGVCEKALMKQERAFSEHASYCHGDMILSNIIKTGEGLYFIDPQYNRKASSYILDLGKMRMSLMNYERRFGLSSADNSHYLKEFDMIMKLWGTYEIVVVTNLMYICRLYRYKESKEAVKQMAKELLRGAENVF